MAYGHTIRAIIVHTALTVGNAVTAKRIIAPLTAVTVVIGNGIATITTRLALPLVQFHVGAATGIGGKNLGHDQEEIAQTSLGDCSADGRSAFSLAKTFILHVGVCNAVVPGRRIGVKGHNTVRRRIALRLPVQTDFKASQPDARQDYGIGGHTDFARFWIHIHLVEFILYSLDFLKNVLMGRDFR